MTNSCSSFGLIYPSRMDTEGTKKQVLVHNVMYERTCANAASVKKDATAKKTTHPLYRILDVGDIDERPSGSSSKNQRTGDEANTKKSSEKQPIKIRQNFSKRIFL